MHTPTLCATGTFFSKALSEWVLLAENCGQGPGQGENQSCALVHHQQVWGMVPTPGAEFGPLPKVWTVARTFLVVPWLWLSLCHQIIHFWSLMLCCIHVCTWRAPSHEDIQGWRLSCFHSQSASAINHSHDEKLYFNPSFSFFSFHQVIQVTLFLARSNSTSGPSCSPGEVLVHCNHITFQSSFKPFKCKMYSLSLRTLWKLFSAFSVFAKGLVTLSSCHCHTLTPLPTVGHGFLLHYVTGTSEWDFWTLYHSITVC